MLQKLSEQVRACHEYAADAKQNAEATADPTLKTGFLDLEFERLQDVTRNLADHLRVIDDQTAFHALAFRSESGCHKR